MRRSNTPLRFKDHFSAQAIHYAIYRPDYPPALFDHLASLCTLHRTAWDCGSGNGQAAVSLTKHFERVYATEPSAKQLANAIPHQRIDYRQTAAEQSGLPAHSVDLLTVAQALHWFDFDRFYAEVHRVVTPGGIIAAWTYTLLRISPEIDRIMDDFYSRIVGAYWPPERQWVDNCYRDVPFPFPQIEMPRFEMKKAWDLPTLIGYIYTWSATQNYIADRQKDPLVEILDQLHTTWGAPDEHKSIVWPMYFKVGKLIERG